MNNWFENDIKNIIFNSKEKTLQNSLYIVPTPIGNIEDITLRALKVLLLCDVIICEDSRVIKKILDKYQIPAKKIIIYNENSDEKVRQKILHELLQEKSLALVSDAGTPLISDPGFKLINFLQKFNQKIIPLPGACAFITALSASGVSSDKFLFLGFLPNSKIRQENIFKDIAKDVAFAFYESPNRVAKTLKILSDILGNRKVVIARELTKIYEEIIADDLDKIILMFENNQIKAKGEFVIIVEKADKKIQELTQEQLIEVIKQDLKLTNSIKETSKNISEIYEINKKIIYNIALKLK